MLLASPSVASCSLTTSRIQRLACNFAVLAVSKASCPAKMGKTVWVLVGSGVALLGAAAAAVLRKKSGRGYYSDDEEEDFKPPCARQASILWANSQPVLKLKNSNGMEVHTTPIGAAITKLIVPDKKGKKADVVLGYDTTDAYIVSGCPDAVGVLHGVGRERGHTLTCKSFWNMGQYCYVCNKLESQDLTLRVTSNFIRGLCAFFLCIVQYAEPCTYFGVVVGRVANRIADAKFKLGEEEFKLYANNGPNSLHGQNFDA